MYTCTQILRYSFKFLQDYVFTLMLQLFAGIFFFRFWIQNILLVLNFLLCFGRSEIY